MKIYDDYVDFHELKRLRGKFWHIHIDKQGHMDNFYHQHSEGAMHEISFFHLDLLSVS